MRRGRTSFDSDDYFGVQVAAIIRTDSTRSRGAFAALAAV
jgi:hypothetical protein